MSDRALSARDRTIRLMAAAAVCGLSISFLAGESFDGIVKNSLAEKIEISFPVITPLYAVGKLFPLGESLHNLTPESPSTTLLAQEKTTVSDRVVYKLAALESNLDKEAIAALPVLAPTNNKNQPKIIPIHQSALTSHENLIFDYPVKEAAEIIEKNSGEIAKARAPVLAKRKIENKVIKDSYIEAPSAKASLDLSDDLVMPAQSTGEGEEHKIAAMQNSEAEAVVTYLADTTPIYKDTTSPELADKSVPEIKIKKTTEAKIRGRLSGRLPKNGHFELGIYESIDAKGEPVGYPYSQKVLPKGQSGFSLKIPKKIESGYVFARWVRQGNQGERWFAYPGNPIQSLQEIAGAQIQVPLQYRDNIKVVAAAPEAVISANEKILIEGKIENAFAAAALSGAKVRVRGGKEETYSGGDGVFKLEVPYQSDTLLLEISAPGYMPVIEVVNKKQNSGKIYSLVAKEAMERMAISLGIRQEADKGMILVQVADAAAIGGNSNISARLSLAAQGPFYFRETGYPAASSELRSTSKDARLVYFNVSPGEGFIELSRNGEAAAPLLVSSVGNGQLINKKITLKDSRVSGRVFRALPGPDGKLPSLTGARVRIEGAPTWTNTDSYGAFELPELVYAAGETILIEIEANGYQKHRYGLYIDGTAKQSRDFFTFPAEYIAGLLAATETDIDERAGIVVGSVGAGKKLRIDALADNSSANNTRDFYFDGAKSIRGGYAATDPRYGTFLLANVPMGRALLQGMNQEGKTNYSSLAHIAPSSVFVSITE